MSKSSTKSPRSRAKLDAVLKIMEAWEASGKAWFQRCNGHDMLILVRDPRLWNGDHYEHWENARKIEAAIVELRILNFGIEIDAHSGHLEIRLPNIYPKEGAQ